jgi:hypothetical protein
MNERAYLETMLNTVQTLLHDEMCRKREESLRYFVYMVGSITETTAYLDSQRATDGYLESAFNRIQEVIREMYKTDD